MTFLPFYQKRTQYNLTYQFRLFIQSYNFGLISLWKTFEIELPNFSDIRIPPKLKENKEIPVERLISEIKNNPLDLEYMPASPPFLTYMIDAVRLGIFWPWFSSFGTGFKIVCQNLKFINGRSRGDERRTVDVEHETRASMMWHHRHPAANPWKMTPQSSADHQWRTDPMLDWQPNT